MLSALLLAAASCTPLYATPGVAQDEGAIYFTTGYLPVRGPDGVQLVNDNYRTLFRQSKSDLAVTPVIRASGAIGAIDIDGPRIWYGATTCDRDGCPLEFQSSELGTVTTTGGAPAVLVDKTSPIRQILHDETHIYWRELVRTGPTDQLFASRIRSYDKRTGAVTTLLDDSQLYVDMILTNDSIVLLGWYSDIVAIPKTGGETPVWRGSDASSRPFFRSGGGIFYLFRSHTFIREPDDSGRGVVMPADPHATYEHGFVGGRYFAGVGGKFGVRELCSSSSHALFTYHPAYFAVDSCAIHLPLSNPVPWPPQSVRVDDIAPGHAAPGSTLTVTGADFDRLANVTLGAYSAAVVAIDDTHLTLVVPPQPPGPALVTVTNPDGACSALWTTVDR